MKAFLRVLQTQEVLLQTDAHAGCKTQVRSTGIAPGLHAGWGLEGVGVKELSDLGDM
jgi:lipid-binding SYLF domain-containing protein